MRFRSKQTPRGLLQSRDKTRLTLLIVAVAIVSIGFNTVRHPKFWSRIFPDSGQNIEQETDTAPAIDLREPTNALQADEFLTVSRSPDSEQQSISVQRIPFQDPETTLPENLVAPIRDNVIGVQLSERAAFYSAMKKEWQLSDEDRADAKPGSYALFIDAPSACRGKLFRLEGRLRKLEVIDASSAQQAVNRYYSAWIELPDSGTGLVHLAMLNASTELTRPFEKNPERQTYEIDHQKAPAVSATGFFFKRESYLSRNTKDDQKTGLSVAPLLVGGTLEYIPAPVVKESRTKEMTPYLGWLTVIVLLAVVMIIWSFAASDAAHTQTRTHQLTRLPATADFEHVEAVSIGESLKLLSEPDNVTDQS